MIRLKMNDWIDVRHYGLYRNLMGIAGGSQRTVQYMKGDGAQQFPRLTLLRTIVTCLFQVVRSSFWLLIKPGQVSVVECESSHLPSPVFTRYYTLMIFDARDEKTAARE